MQTQKKDSNLKEFLILKIDRKLKQEFMIHCIKNDTTASNLIRDFIRSTLGKHQEA